MAQKENKPNISSNIKSASTNETGAAAKTVSSPTTVSATAKKSSEFFHRQNYYLLLGGIVLLIIGFLLMTGGHNDDPNVFDTSKIYSPRRIILAPIVVILGFVVEIFAILWKPKD